MRRKQEFRFQTVPLPKIYMGIKLTEKMIQNQILSYLRTIGIYCWKHWQGPMSSFKGVSDILGIMKDGKFIAIEVKTDRGRVTPEQQNFLDIINKNNGMAFLAKSLDEVMQKIKLQTKPQQNLNDKKEN